MTAPTQEPYAGNRSPVACWVRERFLSQSILDLNRPGVMRLNPWPDTHPGRPAAAAARGGFSGTGASTNSLVPQLYTRVPGTSRTKGAAQQGRRKCLRLTRRTGMGVRRGLASRDAHIPAPAGLGGERRRRPCDGSGAPSGSSGGAAALVRTPPRRREDRPAAGLTPRTGGRGCGTGRPRRRAGPRCPARRRGRRWCGRP